MEYLRHEPVYTESDAELVTGGIGRQACRTHDTVGTNVAELAASLKRATRGEEPVCPGV